MDNKNIPEREQDDIRAALEKLKVGYVEASDTQEADGGIIELSFEDEIGLVFEDETDHAAFVPEVTAEPADEPAQTTASVPDPEPEPEQSAEPCEESAPEEFSIPEEFEVNERFNTPASPIERTKIWSTYVPRFTEVSDTYRMVDDPRPRPQQPAPPTPTAVKSEPDAAPADKTDPTAEIDQEVKDAISVSTEAAAEVKLEDFAESINVYKFSDGQSGDVPQAEKLAFVPEPPAADDHQEPEPIEAEETEEPETYEESEPVADEPAAPVYERRGNVQIPDPTPSVNIIEEIIPEQSPAVKETPTRAIAPHTAKRIIKYERLKEYNAFYQRDAFKDKFLDSILSVKIRLFSLAFIAVLLLLYENLGLFGVNVAELLKISDARAALSRLNLPLCFCALVLALPEIVYGVKLLIKKELTPEVFLIPSFLIIAGTVAWDYYASDSTPALFGLVFAIQALAAVYASCIRKTADFTAFKAVSQNGDKKALNVAKTQSLHQENIALDGAVDGYKSRTVRLFRTSFISDFFKRTAKGREDGFVNLLLVSISAGAALVLSLVCGFIGGGVDSAFDAFALLFMTAIPAASMLLHKLPYSEAERISNRNKTVVIGEESLYEFSDVDVIAFDDTEIFGEEDVALKRFMSYGDKENTEKAMYQMSALFSVVGGPLNSIFTKSLAGKRPVPATNVVIDADGICANVDGKRVHAGTYDYMKRCGISVRSDSAAQSVGADTTKVMYAAEGGAVYAKFYIRYSFSEQFTEILPAIRENGIVPLIYTRDPNISNELLKTLSAGQGVIRVMKKNDIPPIEEPGLTRIDAGIVTYGNKMNAIRSVLLSKKYAELQASLSKAELAAMSAGAVAAAVLSLLGLNVPSLAVAAWQLVCCAGLYITSRKVLDKK